MCIIPVKIAVYVMGWKSVQVYLYSAGNDNSNPEHESKYLKLQVSNQYTGNDFGELTDKMEGGIQMLP